MNRNKFLKTLAKTGIGIGCCGPLIAKNLFGQTAQDQDWIKNFDRDLAESTKTPPWARIHKAELWIKDLMNNIDIHLDRDTRTKLMRANGRSCYLNTFGVADAEKPSQEAVDSYLKRLKDAGLEFKEDGEFTVFEYSWGKEHQNPQGMILGDGNCLCPVVENIKTGLSPTFCLCSAGYVSEIFSRAVGKNVEVEIIETLKTGADDCRFKIKIPNV
jgi:hypothetical protein